MVIYIKELTVRYKKKRLPKKMQSRLGQKVSGSKSVATLFKDLRNEPVEKLFVLHLNNQNKIESFQLIASGTLDSAQVSARVVFTGALLSNAASIICIHNHPSGNPTPSEEDKGITEELKSVGKLIKIRVLDHVIIGDDEYYSFTDARKNCSGFGCYF